MSHLVWIFTVCPLICEFLFWYSFDKSCIFSEVNYVVCLLYTLSCCINLYLQCSFDNSVCAFLSFSLYNFRLLGATETEEIKGENWYFKCMKNRKYLQAANTPLIQVIQSTVLILKFRRPETNIDNSVLQLRRGNRDNIVIIAIFCHKTYFVTHH